MGKSSFANRVFVGVFFAILILETSAIAAVVRVKPSGDDANSGASWALAKKTISAAILAAGEGDEIWVAAGTYPGHIKNKVLNEETDPVPVNVALYGGFAGTEANRDDRNWTVNLSILDGGGGEIPTPPESGSVVSITGGAGPTTRLDGFVIIKGHSMGGDALGKILLKVLWANGIKRYQESPVAGAVPTPLRLPGVRASPQICLLISA